MKLLDSHILGMNRFLYYCTSAQILTCNANAEVSPNSDVTFSIVIPCEPPKGESSSPTNTASASANLDMKIRKSVGSFC